MNYVFEPPGIPALAVAGRRERFPVRRIYCVGQNYAAHTREMGADDRQPPFFFAKPPDAACQSAEVPFPSATDNLHHEVELVVALAAGGENLTARAAERCVFGYAVGVDLTRRDLQAQAKALSRPWTTAKGFDSSAPISEIVPVRADLDVSNAPIGLKVNNQWRQQGNTADMIWPVPELLAELSRYFCLERGDLVFTGTPEGVAPLQPGDAVWCGIDGLASHAFSLTP